jgi:ABC-type sugar transport system ATPase subunit
MRRLREKGLSILYISHRLDEIFEIADRVTVIRDGKFQGTKRIKNITKDQLINMMSGKDIHNSSLVYDSSRTISQEVILGASNVSYKNKLNNVTFSVHKGEIFGICGLVGAGKTELLKCIYNIYQCDKGQIFINGREISKGDGSASQRTEAIGLVPEDRKSEGLFLDLDIISNITIASLRFILRLFFIRKKAESEIADKVILNLGVKVGSLKSAVRFLSGGNQQKVVFAKWVSAKKKFLMLDEPTRGVDIFGKVEIYKLINTLSKSGISILISTSEIDEAQGICDRIGIMNQGSMVKILDRQEFSKERILRTMIANQ